MGKHYYCVICGTTVFPDQNICPNCKNYIVPKESIHDSEYYRNKSMKLIGNYSYWNQILIDEEVSQNPEFNPNTTIHNAEKAYEDKMEQIFKPKSVSNPNQPKCPTCGSTNIEKISTTSRVTHGLMFGLFSKTARSQFKCKNCGNKW